MAVIAGGRARPSAEGMRHDGRSGMPRKTAPRGMEKVDQAKHPVHRPLPGTDGRSFRPIAQARLRVEQLRRLMTPHRSIHAYSPSKRSDVRWLHCCSTRLRTRP